VFVADTENPAHRERGFLYRPLNNRLQAQGTNRVDVANRLEIVSRTVEYHISKLLKKLKVKPIMDAVNWTHKYNPGSITS
jgi:ATP/maltotriose-dependent transcriptional regulator MalT